MLRDFRLVVTGEKGGSGKSMLAVEFALIAANAGVPTVLIDRDPQGTASKLLMRRQGLIEQGKADGSPVGKLSCPRLVTLEGRDVARVLDQEAARGARFQIIDLAGRDDSQVRKAIKAADVVLVPLGATENDLATANEFDALVGRLKGEGARFRDAFFVINKAPTHARRKQVQLEVAIAALTHASIKHIQLLDMAISDRFHFVKGWLTKDDAWSVTELAGSEAAVAELMGVYDRVTEIATRNKTVARRGAA